MRPTIVLALTCLVVPPSLAQPAGQGERTKAELNQLFARVVDALRRRDTGALAAIYDSKYRFAIGGGDSVVVLDRADRLASIAASSDSISTLNVERCDFDVYPATAVGRCWIRQQNVAGAAGAWSGVFTTAVFNRGVNGRWRLVASHASVNRVRR